MRSTPQPRWAFFVPAIVAITLVAAACSGSRPTFEPTTTTGQETDAPRNTTPATEPTSTTSRAAGGTTVPTTTQPVTTTTFVRLDPNDPSYPSVVPLEPIPPAEYPTTG